MVEKDPTIPPPKLLDQVRSRLRVKHYSIRTEQAYVDWTKRFIRFHHKRHPKDMGAQEVEVFLTHLAVKGKVSASEMQWRDVQNLLATGADRAYLSHWAERLGVAPLLEELRHDSYNA